MIKFGTDGWRAVIAEEFTFDNVARAAQAAADYWLAAPESAATKRLVVGYDRRFLSDAFARTTAGILAGNGFEVVLGAAPTPTPAVSYAVRHLGAAGGVMITASHNPPAFNGFKIKAHYAGSADPALCSQVEARLDRRPPVTADFDRLCASGRIRTADFISPHLRAVKRLVDFTTVAQSGLRFAHDALFGVGAGCFDRLLAGTRCRVTTLNGAHDPNFGGINPEPIERNYARSSAWLARHPHDICLVTDGDADRVGAMDGRGRPLSTHNVICVLLRHFIERRGGRGRVVKALTTTSMVDKMCAEHGLSLVETGVGFKHVCAEMLKGDVLLGFEESGGIGFPGHIPERDGILAGLMLLEVLAVEGRSIQQLVRGLERRYGPHRYARSDIRFPIAGRQSLMQALAADPPDRLGRSKIDRLLTFDGVKIISRDGAWLMLRGSGTEPVLRVYAEAASDDAARALVARGVQLARRQEARL